ncbi:nucleotidyltransferase family protein [Candidatus Woesearchaeota archaeon]|nr:nucleotidyltransferase family protein [Candidatus Woesearchaeota archaeon]
MSKTDSRVGLLEREQEVMRIINLFLDKKLDFVVVGGYAISTYKKRFSIDLDIVVSEDDLKKFEKALEKEGYFLHYEKEIALLYGENFKRFRKKMKNLPVDIDLLINGLVCRTTEGTWGIDYIKKHSVKRKLSNSEFLTPERELLIAMKLHSGRLSDIRDVVALMPCNIEKLKKHLQKGDAEKVKTSIKKQFDFLNKPQFDDSFKGIFGPYAYNEKDVQTAKELIKEILEERNTKKLKYIPFRDSLLTLDEKDKPKVMKKDKKPERSESI